MVYYTFHITFIFVTNLWVRAIWLHNPKYWFSTNNHDIMIPKFIYILWLKQPCFYKYSRSKPPYLIRQAVISLQGQVHCHGTIVTFSILVLMGVIKIYCTDFQWNCTLFLKASMCMFVCVIDCAFLVGIFHFASVDWRHYHRYGQNKGRHCLRLWSAYVPHHCRGGQCRLQWNELLGRGWWDP